MKQELKRIATPVLWRMLRATKHRLVGFARECAERSGYIVTRKCDYYAPTPSEIALRTKRARWTKPSGLHGISFDLALMEERLGHLCADYLQEFQSLPSYEKLVQSGFGLGYPYIDAFVLYSMLRQLQPKRYLEVGSGLSTAYAHIALSREQGDGGALITCIEPFPFSQLRSLPNINLITSQVQDVSVEEFRWLEAGDVLFIDSSHIIRIDGDVPFLLLEVLPQLRAGVVIHVHDIPFPFNIPFPPEYWTLLEHPESSHWPMFWNEAMLLQALLMGNSSFEIIQSLPLLRHYREERLRELIPFYKAVDEEPNTFSSLWIRKT
jgi:hypothetical protein